MLMLTIAYILHAVSLFTDRCTAAAEERHVHKDTVCAHKSSRDDKACQTSSHCRSAYYAYGKVHVAPVQACMPTILVHLSTADSDYAGGVKFIASAMLKV
jgi:hypothetical protein